MHDSRQNRAPRGGRVRGSIRAAALTLLALAACASPAPSPSAKDYGRATGPASEPYWASEPLSWAKLSEVEDWIHSRAAQADPYWRIEGELTLAEGRLTLARRDAQGGTDARAIEQRRGAARAGFERVLDDGAANPEQRLRARRGLESVGGPAPRAAAPTGVVTRSQWGAMQPVTSRLNPVGGPYSRITIHHSAEIPGITLNGAYGNSVEALRKIQHHHIKGQGWGDVGYHYLIDSSGRVFEGRDDRYQGAHAGGNMNVRNLGICLLGDYSGHTPSPEALASLEHLIEEYRIRDSIARSNVLTHGDLKNTECPGRHITAWVRRYNSAGGPLTASGATLIGAGRATPRAASTTPLGTTPRATTARRSSPSPSGSVR